MVTPATRFVIFAAPRTGSNWLCTLLDSHPEILCHHEIFHPEGIHLALSRRGGGLDLGTLEQRDRDPAAVLAQVWRTGEDARAVGFKANRDQPRQAFEAIFSERGLRAIVLIRRNRVKTFVSEQIAALTGEWESTPERALRAAPPRIAVDPDELRAHVARNRRYYAWLAERLGGAGWERLETSYEALAQEAERRRLLGFLGVDPAPPLTGATRKQTPRDLRATIVNFHALAGALRGGELESELFDREG